MTPEETEMRTQASRRDRAFCFVTTVLFAASYAAAMAVLKSVEMAPGARIGIARRRYR